jgi:hypothetical protein
MPSRPRKNAFDRRDSVRGPLCALVEAGPSRSALWAHDLSLGGLRCATTRPFWPGTYLDLRFALPDTREPIEAGAQVLTLDEEADGLSLGLRFCSLSDGARLAIFRFLDRRRFLWAPPGTTAGLLEPARLVRPPPMPPLDELLAEVDAALAA